MRIILLYGQTNRLVEVATGTALWYRAGVAPVPICWIIVRDPEADRRRCAGTTPGAGGAEDACEQAEHERSEKEAAAAHGLGP